MTDPAIVEKVARAIALLDWGADRWPLSGEDFMGPYRQRALAAIAAHEQAIKDAGMMICSLCSDCPPVGYPTDETRCIPCPRRAMIAASETLPAPPASETR